MERNTSVIFCLSSVMVAGIGWYTWSFMKPTRKNHKGSCQTGWRPEESLSCFQGKHSLVKNFVQPVHDNVSLVWLGSILLPDSLTELVLFELLLDHLVRQQPLVGKGVHSFVFSKEEWSKLPSTARKQTLS